MGSYAWNTNPCCVQYHNGRPLSVALVERSDENEIVPFGDSCCAMQCRPRSHSSGRRFQRESYRIYHPTAQYTTFNYSPPFHHRIYDNGSGHDGFVERFETITFDEQCQPNRHCIHTSATPVRQVKIRSRPSSCFDLHQNETKAAAAAATTDNNNQWTQVVDERREEHHNWHYNFTLPLPQTVPTHQQATTTTTSASMATQHEDVRIPITSKPVRPLQKDVWTSTEDLPKNPRRPLSISETQVLERYEKNEKIHRDLIAEKSDTGTFTQILFQRPLHRSYDAYTRSTDDIDDGDDDFCDEQLKRTNRKFHRKDFFQRMQVKNGTRSFTSLNVYPEYQRTQMIVRPTVKPREALVDAPAIVAPPVESESTRSLFVDSHLKTRHYLEPI